MPLSQSKVIEMMDKLIEILSQRLPEIEHVHGWSERSRINYHNYFIRLRKEVISEEAIDHTHFSNLSIPRSMDHWGINGGDIMERAATISELIRNNHKDWKVKNTK